MLRQQSCSYRLRSRTFLVTTWAANAANMHALGVMKQLTCQTLAILPSGK
jgi:hypothetical protein